MEEAAPAAPAFKKKPTASKVKPAAKTASPEGKKKKKKKSKGPGKYSQLVIDAIRTLGEKNGSSLFKIYNEAKKVTWFDQQNGRMYLRYSIRALLLNDTLVQVKGLGANGSFKLNKKKFEAKSKKSPSKPAKAPKPNKKPAKKAGEKKKKSLKSVKKTSSAAKKTARPKKAPKKKTNKAKTTKPKK